MTSSEIRTILLENRLELYGQPKWTIGKNTCNTYEVFAEKLVLPDGKKADARPVINRIRADGELTDLFSPWFLDAALRSGRRLSDETGANLTLSMNVLPLYCNRIDFPLQVRRALEETGFRPDKLHLELSESQQLTQTGIENLNALHNELGLGLWLANFGLGHSNIALLNLLDVDGLEIDRSFAAFVPSSDKACKVLVAIAHFADTLDLKVCAKGVELEDQMQFFEDYHYYKAQGYLIGAPMPLPDLKVYIQKYAKAREN